MAKLLICLLGATLALGQKFARYEREIPRSEREGFHNYLNRIQLAFANPTIQPQIQAAFSSDSARQWFLNLLESKPPKNLVLPVGKNQIHYLSTNSARNRLEEKLGNGGFKSGTAVNWGDGQLSLGEFLAWYPTVVLLSEKLHIEPGPLEEWTMADFEPKDGEVTPIELYAMLRDTVGKPFFHALFSLLYVEATKTKLGFFNPGTKTTFESGSPIGVIAGLPQVQSDQGGLQIFNEVEEECDKFEANPTQDQILCFPHCKVCRVLRRGGVPLTLRRSNLLTASEECLECLACLRFYCADGLF